MPGTVLVTGGAGYIGSHTCKALRAAGYVPLVVDDLSNGHRAFVKWGELIEGDFADPRVLASALSMTGLVGIVHFAAFIEAGESVKKPHSFFCNNLVKTLGILDALRERPLPIVFSSSAAVYGEPVELPIPETHPRAPTNPYGATKLGVEMALEAYANAYGLRYAALRYFNAAGADPDLEIGEAHDPETHLIPLAIRAALDGTRPLALYGNDYDTPDGTAIRDYVHVCDIADAHVRALDYLLARGSPLVANLGAGKGSTVHEVIEMVETVLGRPVPHVVKPRRPGDVARLVAKVDTANRALQWASRRSSLHEIVETAARWQGTV